MTASYEIRRATVRDMTPLCELMSLMHEEIAFFEYDAVKALEQIQGCVLKGYVALAETEGEIIGSIGLTLMQQWYSTVYYLGDMWTFVRADHRNSHAAQKLLKHVNGVSEQMGVVLIMGVLTGKDPKGKNGLFRRYMTPIGETFVKGIAADV